MLSYILVIITKAIGEYFYYCCNYPFQFYYPCLIPLAQFNINCKYKPYNQQKRTLKPEKKFKT